MNSPSIFASLRFRFAGVLGSVVLLTAFPLTAMVIPWTASVKVANPLRPASAMPKLPASALAQSDKPHTMAASIYRIAQNLKTTLMLNNKGPRPLEVRPTLYNLSGERLEIPPVTLEANSYSVINMSDLAAPGGEAFREGSLQVFYRGNDLLLGAQVKMMDEARSLVFDEQLVEHAMMFKSSRLEGVWWLPFEECQVEIGLSNTTDLPLTSTVLAQGAEAEQKSSTFITLQAHETRVINLKDLLTDKAVLPGMGSVSITHQGQPGALLARGFVQESAKGFSSSIQFVDPANLKSAILRGTGLHLGQIAGDELRPVVAAHNIGDATAVVSGKLCFTSKDGLAAGVPIAKMRLRAGELRLVSLKSALRHMNLDEIATAGLEFQYKGKPGSVMMSALSVSTSGNQVYQVPMLDPAAQKSSTGGYPWHIGDSSSTMLYIMNSTDRLQYYAAYLKVAGGDYVMGTSSLEPGQTVTYDIRALRDNQVRDRDGRTIPVESTSGQFYWSIIQSESGATTLCMIGRAEQVDQMQGTSSSYACQNCCNIRVADYGISPTFVQTVVGNTVSFSVWQDNYDCNDNIFPSNPPSVGWSSSNNTIAKMNGNVATAKSGGTVTITAQWNAYQTSPSGDPFCGPVFGPQNPKLPDPCACSNNPQHISVNATLVVQVPAALTVLAVTTLPDGSNQSTCGCTDTNATGIKVGVRYQVKDQMGNDINSSKLEPQEKVTNTSFEGVSQGDPVPNWIDIGPSRIDGTSQFTDANGRFLDAPYGFCGPTPFASYFFKQQISILVGGQRYVVRTNNVTVSGTTQGHGSMTNGSDVQKSRP